MQITILDQIKTLGRGSSWRTVRNDHIKREPYCQCCGRHKQLEVHHFIPWHIDTELRLDPRNLVTLCRPCHFRFGHLSNWKDANDGLRHNLTHMHEFFVTKTRKARNWNI